MTESGQRNTTPSNGGDDGVRILRKPPARRGVRPYVLAAVLLAVAAVSSHLLLAPESANRPTSAHETAVPEAAVASRQVAAVASATAVPSPARPVAVTIAHSSAYRAQSPAATQPDPAGEQPAPDPNDLASHFRPGDPEPTMAELIEALNHAGIRTGIGAFNPPGTSPPLAGLAVPEDFALPEGFVRHHQVTDDGEPIEAILMFSPDYDFYDADGQLLSIPEDRIVPPELAPPGLPIREVAPPKP